jgi:hypothetical protein
MPETDQIEESGSLADHEAQFLPKRGQEPVSPPAVSEPEAKPQPAVTDHSEEADEALAATIDPSLALPKPKEKHRAEKDKARAQDVPRIKELTRQLKEAQEKLAAATKAPAAQPDAMPVVAPPAPVRAAASPVGEKFSYPTYDAAVAQNPNLTWDDWNDAKAEARIDWREARAAQTYQQTYREQQETQARQGELNTFFQRRDSYLQQHPDRVTAFQTDRLAQMPATPIIERLLKISDNGPDLVYTLQQRPDLLAGLVLFTDGKPASEGYVALATQWLQSQLVTGNTAAVPAVSTRQPPRPPTAVRTGPLKTGQEPPGDGASLADHEAFYNARRR